MADSPECRGRFRSREIKTCVVAVQGNPAYRAHRQNPQVLQMAGPLDGSGFRAKGRRIRELEGTWVKE